MQFCLSIAYLVHSCVPVAFSLQPKLACLSVCQFTQPLGASLVFCERSFSWIGAGLCIITITKANLSKTVVPASRQNQRVSYGHYGQVFCFRFVLDLVDIDNSILVHTEFESGKSMADNGGPVRVILNRRSLGFTSLTK